MAENAWDKFWDWAAEKLAPAKAAKDVVDGKNTIQGQVDGLQVKMAGGGSKKDADALKDFSGFDAGATNAETEKMRNNPRVECAPTPCVQNGLQQQR